jgi:hypothetical protein
LIVGIFLSYYASFSGTSNFLGAPREIVVALSSGAKSIPRSAYAQLFVLARNSSARSRRYFGECILSMPMTNPLDWIVHFR